MVLIKVIAIHSNSLSSPFPHPCHSLFFSRDHLRSPSGIISGPTWGSFAVQLGDHLRSNLGIICGPIWGSFAVQLGDHLRSNLGIICGPIWGPFAVQFGDHLRSGITCGLGWFADSYMSSVFTLWLSIICLYKEDIGRSVSELIKHPQQTTLYRDQLWVSNNRDGKIFSLNFKFRF